jgi:hypothetical protein
MFWNIEFNQLYGCFQLEFNDSDKIYMLEADEYEQALDQAAVLLQQLGFYSES